MRAKLNRDRQRRLIVIHNEVRYRRYKVLLKHSEVCGQVRESAVINFEKLPRDASPSRVENRCIFTGRSRGVQRVFRMSRIQLQKLAKEGKIPGLRKASW